MKRRLLIPLITIMSLTGLCGQASSIFIIDLPPEAILKNKVKAITATDEQGAIIYQKYYNPKGELIKSESSGRPTQYFISEADEAPFAFNAAHPRGYILYINADTVKEERLFSKEGRLRRVERSIYGPKGQLARREIFNDKNELESYTTHEYDGQGRLLVETTSSGQDTSKWAVEYDRSGRSKKFFVGVAGRQLREEEEILENGYGGETEHTIVYEPALNIKIDRFVEKDSTGEVVKMIIDNNDGRPATEVVMQMALEEAPRLEKVITLEGGEKISELVYNYLEDGGKEDLVDRIVRINYKDGEARDAKVFHDFEYEFF